MHLGLSHPHIVGLYEAASPGSMMGFTSGIYHTLHAARHVCICTICRSISDVHYCITQHDHVFFFFTVGSVANECLAVRFNRLPTTKEYGLNMA